MNWDDLRFVLALARTGTLTGAGRQLGVDRTTVGRRLRALEQQLGVRLFDAEGVEGAVLAAESRLSGRDAQLEGPLRVSTVDFLYACFADAFDSFVRAHPRVRLSVLSTDEEVSLRRREADIAVRLNDRPPDSLVGRRLGQLEFRVYAAQALADAVGSDDPNAFPWLRFDARDDGRGLDAWYRRYAPDAPFALGFDSYTLMRDAVRTGTGAHFLARLDAERFDGLVDLGPAEDAPRRTLWALTLPELRTNSRVRAFLEHLDGAVRGRVA
jgi:DNA-binding transcriptional LysR family regulator